MSPYSQIRCLVPMRLAINDTIIQETIFKERGRDYIGCSAACLNSKLEGGGDIYAID